MNMGSKMGRPVIGNLKNNDIKVRVDDETLKKLLEYCKEKEIKKIKHCSPSKDNNVLFCQGVFILMKYYIIRKSFYQFNILKGVKL